MTLAWSTMIAGSLALNWMHELSGARQTARQEALFTIQNDLVYELRNSPHGGLYVQVTPQIQPTPSPEPVPEEDIATLWGRKLTLVDPAHMANQKNEWGRGQYGAHGHITSLKPIRPENAPDQWEREALESFQQGVKETSSVAEFEEGQYVRLMRPLIATEECLQCHGEQGYKSGDVQGGISVSIPMATHLNHAHNLLEGRAIRHGFVWLLGMVVIVLGSRSLQRTHRKLQQSIHTSAARENRLQAITEASPLSSSSWIATAPSSTSTGRIRASPPKRRSAGMCVNLSCLRTRLIFPKRWNWYSNVMSNRR